MAFERVVERKIEASVHTLRGDLEKKMNHRWEFIEGKISAVESKVGLVENNVSADVEALRQHAASEKEAMEAFVERAVQAQQAETGQNTRGVALLQQVGTWLTWVCIAAAAATAAVGGCARCRRTYGTNWLAAC